ncbi:type II secretion system F family protein [Devosia sp.]|uniref:type II secretion system F family protein n=1 Tax=Devosia sp. TaxID=1871048 RepID=UPI002EDF3559
MPLEQLLIYVIYALAAATAILLIEALYLQFVAGRRQRAINRRLARLSGDVSQQESLRNLLRERGLSDSGDYVSGLVWLNRLYVQSGVAGRPLVFAAWFFGVGAVIALTILLLGGGLLAALLAWLLVALALPFWLLRRSRSRRLKQFERQLPDALEMIVRSLRAGHPTSVAIGLVAREMPDPVGTEFGIVADEVSFGADLETGFRKMAERVGLEGLQLLSVAISIQSKTGGNLSEILHNLSKVMRERLMLRLKIRALSSEGRVSAIMLTAFPVVMFGVLLLIAPSYYGDVWGDPLILPVFAGFGLWALFGDMIMYRMVNFDF